MFGLDLIPFDFVCFEVEGIACAVAYIHRCVLWLVGVVDYAILAVFNICVHLDIVVCRIPTVKLVLCRCAPKNCAVEHAAVFE